jgi:hypothetical protein
MKALEYYLPDIRNGREIVVMQDSPTPREKCTLLSVEFWFSHPHNSPPLLNKLTVLSEKKNIWHICK